jgi:hypothetical protein
VRGSLVARCIGLAGPAAGAFCVGALAVALVRWWQAPAPVPDHAAPFVATQPLLFAGRGSISQRVTARRDGLRAVDLILVAENPDLPGSVEVRLAEWPSGRELRLARRPAAAVAAGEPWRFRPGQPDEQWQTFGFDPVLDSAGRDFVITLAYPEGNDAPGSRLAVLAHFPRRYPDGTLAIGGDALSGNLLFRLAGSGTHGEAVRQAGDNLAREQPYFPTSLVVPTVLAILCLCGATGLAAAVMAQRGPGAAGETERAGKTLWVTDGAGETGE